MTDPVTNAIISALSAGAVNAAGDISNKAISDAYGGLKALIKRKFDRRCEAASKAISALESKPDSKGRKETLKEELDAIGAGSDSEVVAAAERLVSLIKALPQGERHLQYAKGTGIAQADRGGVASVTMATVPKRDD
jgi:hypothetical protein